MRFCADIGLDGIEIIQSQEAGCEDLLDDALAQTGLAVCSYVCVVDLLCPDAAELARNEDLFRRQLDRAKALSAGSVMYFPAAAGRTVADDERKAFIEAAQRWSERVGEMGLTLTIETVGAGAGTALHGRIEHMREIAEGVSSSHFRLAFDTGNFVMVGQDPAEAIGPLAGYIGHLHVKDVVRVDEGYPEVPAGRGCVDFAAIFAGLRAQRYDGYFSVECAGPGDRAAKEAMVSASVANTRKLWGEERKA